MPATIKLGDTGDDVRRLQRVFTRTKVLGPDDVDGVFGPKTEQAVKDFQQSNGLVADGIVGPTTWSKVHPYREASPTLKAGSLGPVVAMLQGVLKTGFGYAGAIDGIFGPATETVVRQYQANCRTAGHRHHGRADLAGARRRGRRDAREPLGPAFLIATSFASRRAERGPGAPRAMIPARRSAHAALVLEGIDNLPGLRADNSIDGQVAALLQHLHRRLGLRAEATVDTAGIEAHRAHPALQAADGQAGRAGLEHRVALVGFVDVDPGHPADHAVGRDSLRLLETP